MSSKVSVGSIDALEELRTALSRFSAETQETLSATSFEVQRVQEWLAQRQTHWQREVQRRQQMVQQAQVALQRCQSQVTYDRQTGRTYRPDCSALEVQVSRARAYLAEGEAELQNVLRWVRLVQQAIADYQRQAQRLAGLLASDMTKATAMLGHSAAMLRSIAAMTGPSSGPAHGSATIPSSISQAAPTSVWLERGIHNVPLHQIDLRDSSVADRADFRKVSHEEMQEGIRKLEEVVRPGVQNGGDGEHFSQMDAQLGLDYAQGYRRIYDAFYGDSSPIRLNQIGDRYEVVNGYHRLFVAQQLGVESIPAQVASPATPQERFQSAMASLDSKGRGAWGEQQLRREIARLEHRVLLMHEKPTTPGYDGVSWDGHTVHIWEVKNYSHTTQEVGDLSALENRRLAPNVAQFLQDLVNDSDHPAIIQAVQNNAVQVHIRLGPDTDISFIPLNSLDWPSVDVKQYNYEQMLGAKES